MSHDAVTVAHEAAPGVARTPSAPQATGRVVAHGPPAATLAYLTPIGEFIHSADAKAATILTVLGIMFTLLARFGGWIEELLRGRTETMAAAVVLLGSFAAAALSAVIQSFRTISPRFLAPPRVSRSSATSHG